jgi:aspartate/methionine/tyrosine aminotransferase
MNESRSNSGSRYMEWAKLRSSARYNLATSGVASLSLAELGADISQLEINGPGGYGYEPLLRAIADRYDVPQESVVSAIGTSMANYLALAATTEPGDEVLIEHPAYEPLVSTARYLGLTVTHFERSPDKNFAIDLLDLERRITPRTRVIAITDLHNPSGALCPRDTLLEIAAIARKIDIYVLVDEVYREMLFETRPQSAFHVDPERFLITNSLTKAYGLSGLRCGWVLARPDLARRMWRINDLHGVNFVHPSELLSVIAFEKLPAISGRMSDLLQTNRKLLRQFLDSREDLNCCWPEYGTIVFPRLRHGNADQLSDFLREHYETSVVPGSFFGSPQHFRIGVGQRTETVESGLNQLAKGLDAFAKTTLRRTAGANLDRSAAGGIA